MRLIRWSLRTTATVAATATVLALNLPAAHAAVP